MHFVRRIRSAVASTVIDFYADTLQQKGRPINIEAFGGMDLDKLYKSCTPERHWESILVNAECVSESILVPVTLMPIKNDISLLERSFQQPRGLQEDQSEQGS